ncbi:MAG: galactose mutarotase [Rudaea sp.]|nr:galactose mutarotase [Rudaea sp.]
MREQLATLALGLCALSGAAQAAETKRESFGTLADGRAVETVTLDNGRGAIAQIITLGASLHTLSVPDRAGKSANITLGYAALDDYLKKPQYFGATVGRYANRIANGRFDLDGHTYQLSTNEKTTSLHGGERGLDKVLWQIGELKHGVDAASVSLSYVSADGEMGYPGKLSITATYTLDTHNRLSIEYRATTDKPTIVNLSNHAYWNLSGEGSGSVMDQRLRIVADAYLPVDEKLIPTGEVRSVAGSVFDFRETKPIGRDIRRGDDAQLLVGHGYDHNFVVARSMASAPRLVAQVEDPASGRVLKLLSAQPGLQFYSGNFLDGSTVGTGGRVYRQGDAFALEPQLFPDTPNQPAFGSARLDPGKDYRNLIVYEFSTAAAPPSH